MTRRVERHLERLRRELRRSPHLDVERIVEEIRDHVEETVAEGVAAGTAPERAERQALARTGSPRELARAWGVTGRRGGGVARWRAWLAAGEVGMESWRRDLGVALRGLVRSSGYATAFVLTLGLGIGVNTAIFSAVNRVLMQPLPYAGGERLVYLRHEARAVGLENALFSVPEIDDYRRQAGSFSGVAEFSSLTFTVLGLDQPRRVEAGIVTGNYFDVMGLGARVGRTLGPQDDGPEAAPVAVLTDELWRRLFGADPGAVGRVVRMNGRSVEIVGVAAPAPPWPERTDLYVNTVASPHHLSATMTDDRLHRMTEVFARLAPGATLEEARSEVEAITARLHAEYPDAYEPSQGYAVTLTPLRERLSSRARGALLVLLGVTGFVLLIACANAANLSLARVIRRREELALRAALGASSRALRRQLLAESLIPSLAGAALGVLLAWGSAGLLSVWIARYTARAGEIRVDLTALLVSLAAGVLAALVFALLPRLPGSDPRVAAAPPAYRATAGRAGRRTQRGLVVVQVATTFALLAGAGLLLRTLLELQGDHGGLEIEEVLSMEVPITGPRSPEQRQRFYEEILEGSAALPGVRSAALGSRVPLRGLPEGLGAFIAAVELELESLPVEPGRPLPRADLRSVSRGYFGTLGLTLLQGRLFEPTDGPETQRVVVINRSMADDLFGGRDPVGHRLGWRGDVLRFIGVSREWRTIVGVVADSADYGVAHDVPHVVYHPFAQEPWASSLFLRTPTPSSTASAAVALVRELDPDQPVENVATLEQIHADAIAPQRLNATLVGGFALLALLIAAVGIGGVLAFGVSERTRELGVRAALGADRGRLVRLVLAEGGALAGIGLAAGGALSAATSRLVEGLLFRVPPHDAPTLAGVAAGLMGVALLASWAPARRAASVDPARALRAE